MSKQVVRKQRSIGEFSLTPVTPARAKKITKFVMNVIIGDMRPLSLVEGENFKALIHELAPGYTLPSRRTITRLIEDEYVLCKTAIRRALSDVRVISLTVDMWSNIKMQSFLGITAHFIRADDFRLISLVIATREVKNNTRHQISSCG